MKKFDLKATLSGEPYFYITGGIVEYEDDYWDSNKFDKSSAERGGCYRTREDAQNGLIL